MFFATFDIEGNPTGFYIEELHGDKIPKEAISITEDDWKMLNSSDNYIYTESGVIKAPEKLISLEEAIKHKLQYLALLRYEKETSGVEFNGIKISTDRESVSILNSTLASLVNGFAETIEWKTDSGEFTSIDIITLTEISRQVFEHVQNCFKQENVHALNIKQLTSVEDVNAYDIESGW